MTLPGRGAPVQISLLPAARLISAPADFASTLCLRRPHRTPRGGVCMTWDDPGSGRDSEPEDDRYANGPSPCFWCFIAGCLSGAVVTAVLLLLELA